MYRIKSELIWNEAVVFNWIWIESEYTRVNPQLIWKFEASNASDIVYLLYRWCGKHIVIVKLIFIVYCYKATEISPPPNHTHLNHQTETINILLLITQKNQLLQYIDTTVISSCYTMKSTCICATNFMCVVIIWNVSSLNALMREDNFDFIG